MKPHGIDLDSPAIRDFCRRWKIHELSVFGSILRDDFRPDSDIDFLADYDEDATWDLFDAIHMREELEALLGRSVDIVDRFAIEHDANRFVKKAILSTAELIYGQG
jgi:uncharacterized protein